MILNIIVWSTMIFLRKTGNKVMEPILEYYKHDARAKCLFINKQKNRKVLNKSTAVKRKFKPMSKYVFKESD